MTARKVLLIDEFDSDMALEQHLGRHGYQVATLKLQALDLPQVVQNLQPDAVVLNLYRPGDHILRMILTLNERCAVPVIMFAEDQQTDTINKVIKAGVSAYIVDGLEPRRIKAIIEVAIARFNEQQALKNELQKTKTQLEDRKHIDRAKAILIKSQGYGEEEAYHALRKLAMDRKVSIGEMARNVIAMAELLGKP
ncbi:ANTAR domain-containing response regulator [Methylomonas rapida]|jgi:Response regulator with putative antiterminator output domain|uniref:ANTAR domain-containing protein n=1 Tax=Methylomonas rapida TaxID=2963939 RepID=A0ABY7GPD1_9GAMM|nr:ANTAR domain-containing protein [Methylomonas rapida]WAR46367.1 ANTAR domain-containing protein [Methylomonas rapida]